MLAFIIYLVLLNLVSTICIFNGVTVNSLQWWVIDLSIIGVFICGQEYEKWRRK